jgi:galactofuranose transport system ATP-binding protein
MEIRTLIRGLASKGMGFLFTSAELEEVVHIGDRVVVLRDRRKVGELAGAEVNEAAVMAMIAQGEETN